MKIAIESPAKLTDEDLENIIDVWKRQPRRIIVLDTVEPHYNGHLGAKSSWLLYRGGLLTEWHSKSHSICTIDHT